MGFAAPEGLARELTAPEGQALADTVQRFDAAMKGNDFNAITQTIPPRILEHIAKQAGGSAEDLRKIIVLQMEQVLNDVKIVSFAMDMATAEHRQLPDGTPYVLIPTETVIEIAASDDRTAVRSHTLAFADDGKWYLLRVNEAEQLAILREVYPAFAEVQFPDSSMEAVQP